MKYVLNDPPVIAGERVSKPKEVVRVEIHKGFISLYTDEYCTATFALSEFSQDNVNKLTIIN